MRYSGIGGQAVIEGVMMKGSGKYAVSVRKPDGNIVTKVENYKSLKEKHAVLGVPIIRGVVSFVESLVMGMKTLNYSSSFWEDEEGSASGKDKKGEKGSSASGKDKKGEKSNDLLMGLAVMAGVMLAIGLFVLLPFFVSELLSKAVKSVHLRGLIEGVIRVFLFVGYVKAISYMEDIRRVFMYHGAEHKCINCIENGHELTVKNAKKQTTVHKRCGTSFMLVVMFVSILFFMFISVSNMWIRMALRVLLIPVIAGISYEFILLAGKSENPVITVLSKPGLWLQSLTTKEPDADMLEVAITSVEAVFDWKKFLEGADGEEENVPTDENAPVASEVPAEENASATGDVSITEKIRTADAPAAEAAVSKEKTDEVPKETVGFEVVEVGDDDDDDEILRALDRYFDAPERTDTDGAKGK